MNLSIRHLKAYASVAWKRFSRGLSKPKLLYLVMEVLEAELFTQFFGCMLSGV